MRHRLSAVNPAVTAALVSLTISFFWIAYFEYLIRPFFPPWKQLIVAMMLVSITLSYYRLVIMGRGREQFLALPEMVRIVWRWLISSLVILGFGLVWSVIFQKISTVSTLYTIILYATPVIVATWFLLNPRYLLLLSTNKRILILYVILVVLSCVGLILDKAYGTFAWVIPGNQYQFEFWTKSLIDPTQVRQGFFFGPANTAVYPLMLLFTLSISYMKEASIFVFALITFSIVYATQSTNSLLFCLCFAVLMGASTFMQGKIATLVQKPLLIAGTMLFLLSLLTLQIDDSVRSSSQYTRAIDNVESSAQVDDSNSRINIWFKSIDTFTTLPPLYQLLGTGYGSGTTRAIQLESRGQSGDIPSIGHGESSYLQALGEGGFAGILLRLTPLALFLTACLARAQRHLFVLDPICAYIVSVYLANTFAPHMETYHVQYSLGVAIACYIFYSEKPLLASYRA